MIFTLFQGCSRGGEGRSVTRDPAPDFNLELFDGGSFRLSNHKGKPVVINFWASWCVPCREEAPRLERAYKGFKDRGVEFIGIAVQDTEIKAREFAGKYGLTFPVGIDKKGDIKDAYRVYGIPTTFFIDGDGMISHVHIGGVTEEVIRDELEKLL